MKLNPVTWVLVGIIKIYQYTLSAIFGRSCRFLPTCSHYTLDAILKFGPWAGLWLGLSRFWRCRPGGDDGFDPLPENLPTDSKWYFPWRYGRWRALSHPNPH